MSETERIQVSCARCSQARDYGWSTFKHYRHDCPVAWLEEMLPPSCFHIVTGMPAECVREVVVVSPENGCTDEG